MALWFSLFAVVILTFVVFMGVEMGKLQVLFGVIIPYAALAIFIVGVISRVVRWARSPVPFRITTTCGQQKSLPWMWTSAILAIVSLILLINPVTRRREDILSMACVAVFASLWIEKGLGLVITGFIPSPLGRVFEYSSTGPEVMITLGIWAMGFLMLAVLYKIAVAVKEEIAT